MITRLSVFGLPGRRSTFVAKEEAVVEEVTGKQGGGKKKKDEYPEDGYFRHLYPDIQKKQEVLTLKKDVVRSDTSRQKARAKAREEERKLREEIELINLIRLDAGLKPLESKFEAFSERLGQAELDRLALKKKILLLLAAA